MKMLRKASQRLLEFCRKADYSHFMITLPPALERLVKNQVKSGLYASEVDVVCEALRRSFGHEATTEWIREQAEAGFAQLNAGESNDLSRNDILAGIANRRAS